MAMLFAGYRPEPEMEEADAAEGRPGRWQLPKLTFRGIAMFFFLLGGIVLIVSGYVYFPLAAQRAGAGGQGQSLLDFPGLKSNTGALRMLENAQCDFFVQIIDTLLVVAGGEMGGLGTGTTPTMPAATQAQAEEGTLLSLHILLWPLLCAVSAQDDFITSRWD